MVGLPNIQTGNTPTGVGKTLRCWPPASMPKKHPHGRGEDTARFMRKSDYVETPPRAWGRPLELLSQSLISGNTPTGVGKTTPCSGVAAPTSETPPRAWGRPSAVLQHHWPHRNTPTGVGKTAAGRCRQGVWQKHPHGRGEDALKSMAQLVRVETPPRAWGRLAIKADNRNRNRNTPTGVGKTRRQQRQRRFLRKHPHGRGEDSSRLCKTPAASETPPRAWGRLINFRAAYAVAGNTPTGVGKTTRLHLGLQLGQETPPRAWGRRAAIGWWLI